MHGWCSVAAWSVASSTQRPSGTSSSAAAAHPTWSVQCMPVPLLLAPHAGCCLGPRLDICPDDSAADPASLNSSTTQETVKGLAAACLRPHGL